MQQMNPDFGRGTDKCLVGHPFCGRLQFTVIIMKVKTDF